VQVVRHDALLAPISGGERDTSFWPLEVFGAVLQQHRPIGAWSGLYEVGVNLVLLGIVLPMRPLLPRGDHVHATLLLWRGLMAQAGQGLPRGAGAGEPLGRWD
jgi:hypothetical protein